MKEEIPRPQISSLRGNRLEENMRLFQPVTWDSPHSSYFQPGGRHTSFIATREEQESGHHPPLQGRGPIHITGLKSSSQRRGDIDMNESENVFMH